MSGRVVAIFVTPKSGDAPTAQESANLEVGKGLVGDRYYDRGIETEVTFVDADAIAEVNVATGWSLTPEETRRNIVTQGIDLNQWETSRFRVGDTLLEGVELCEPCSGLGGYLQNDSRGKAEVVKALVHKAGLSARVIEGGEIKPGDSVESA